MESGSTIFIGATILMALGRFAAFAISPASIGPESKPGTAPEVNRVHFVRQGLFLIHGFLEVNFGPCDTPFPLSVIHKFLKVMSISAFVVLGVFVFSNALDDAAWNAPSDTSMGASGQLADIVLATLACFAALVLFNAAFETISIYVVRLFTRPFRTMGKIDPLPLLLALSLAPAGLAVIYLCFITTMNASFSAILTIRGTVAGYPVLEDPRLFAAIQHALWQHESLPRLLNPIAEGSSIVVGNATLLSFCFLPLMPLGLLVFAIAVGAVLDIIDVTSGKALSRRISGRKGSDQVVFTAALVLAVIGGALSVVIAP